MLDAEKDINELAEEIKKEIRNLEEVRNSLIASLREVRVNASDENDAGTENDAVLKISASLERTALRLKDLYEADHRIRIGTFGICDGCEKDIPAKRLQNCLATTLCISCKEELEKLAKK